METIQKNKIDTSRIGNTAEDTKPKTAEDKRRIVNEHRIKEIERIRDILKVESTDLETDIQPIAREDNENNREPLSIDTTIIKKILLSWGGGSDGFKLYFSKDKELLSGVYFMADWGEYEENELTAEEAEEVFNFYMYGEYID